MPHVVLVGDSILDNGAYTHGGPDVVSQVRALLAPGWKRRYWPSTGRLLIMLRARSAVSLSRATHLVLSVGGNNALMHLGILRGTGFVDDQLDRSTGRCRVRFRAPLPGGHCSLPGQRPSLGCLSTIYNGCFPDRVFPTHRLDDAHGVQRRHHSSGYRAFSCGDRPSLCLRHSCRLCQPDRAIVGGREKIARAIVGLVCGGNPMALATRIAIA